MPKKLAQLVRDIGAIETDYRAQMSELLRIKDDLPKHSSKVLGDIQDKLKRRIDELKKKDQKGTVGQFYNDASAKKLIDNLDNHKKKLWQLCDDYWNARNEFSKIAKSMQAVLDRTDAIIAEKQNQWFSSSSLPAIIRHRKFLGTLHNYMLATVTELEPLPKSSQGVPPSLDPDGTKSISIDTLTARYQLPKIDKFLNYFSKGRAEAMKKQTADFRATVEDLGGIAKRESNV